MQENLKPSNISGRSSCLPYKLRLQLQLIAFCCLCNVFSCLAQNAQVSGGKMSKYCSFLRQTQHRRNCKRIFILITSSKAEIVLELHIGRIFAVTSYSGITPGLPGVTKVIRKAANPNAFELWGDNSCCSGLSAAAWVGDPKSHQSVGFYGIRVIHE